MRKPVRRHRNLAGNENKTDTIFAAAAAKPSARAGRCGYVVASGAAPFCDRPTLSGCSYCARHRTRCAVGPASPDFAGLAEAQARAGAVLVALPPELAWLKAPVPLEPIDDSDDEVLAGLDLPLARIFHDD